MNDWRDDFRNHNGKIIFDEPSGLLICGDSLEILPTFPSRSVDLVLTDPPYGISKKGGKRMAFDHGVPSIVYYGEWDEFESERAYATFICRMLYLMHRVAKKDASLYIWADRKFLGSVIVPYLEAFLKWKLRNKLYARKLNPAPHIRKSNWNSLIQECGYFVRGKPAAFDFLDQKTMWNVLDYVVGQIKPIHPTEKHPNLIAPLVAVSSKPGMLVLDPFAGSCIVAQKAKEFHCRFIAIEKELEYCEKAKERISQRILF